MGFSGGGSTVVAGKPYAFLPTGWDTNYRAAVAAARANTGDMTIAFLGHSMWQGTSILADILAQRTATLLTTALAATMNGVKRVYYPVADSVLSIGAWAGTPPWVLAASGNVPISYSFNNSTTAVLGVGFHKAFGWAPAAAGPIATFTFPTTFGRIAGGAASLWYYDNVAGNFDWRYNGGALQNVITTGSKTLKLLAIVGAAASGDTFDFMAQSANNLIYVLGMEDTVNTGGRVVLHNWQQGGQYPQPLFNVANTTVANLATIQRVPDLLICSLGLFQTGDSGYTPELYGEDLGRIIRAFRRAAMTQRPAASEPGISMLIVGSNFPDGVYDQGQSYGGGLSFSTDAAIWDLYLREELAQAMRYNCGHLSLQGLWGGDTVLQGYRGAADVHLLAAGHTAQSNALLALGINT